MEVLGDYYGSKAVKTKKAEGMKMQNYKKSCIGKNGNRVKSRLDAVGEERQRVKIEERGQKNKRNKISKRLDRKKHKREKKSKKSEEQISPGEDP